jgi:hypothetical protein
MTLVIAGYDYEKSLKYTWGGESTSDQDKPEMEVCGLFIAADSAISSHNGGRTLLNGFKKVYCIKANLWKPYFMPDGSFKDYLEIHEQREVFVAFAGSTLTAQHIINSITAHLENLRITFGRHGDGSIYYNAIRHCQKNPLIAAEASYWADDTFLPRNFEGLLTGEIISKTTEYSINEALLSAGRYKLSMEEFQAMRTELVLGVWCPYRKRYELHLYRMLQKPGNAGGLIAYTEGKLLEPKEIAVLGMRTQFETSAQVEFENSIRNNLSPSATLNQFLKKSIEKVQESGSKEIDHPISFRRLNRNGIERIE